jgi:hypothetical protein
LFRRPTQRLWRSSSSTSSTPRPRCVFEFFSSFCFCFVLVVKKIEQFHPNKNFHCFRRASVCHSAILWKRRSRSSRGHLLLSLRVSIILMRSRFLIFKFFLSTVNLFTERSNFDLLLFLSPPNPIHTHTACCDTPWVSSAYWHQVFSPYCPYPPYPLQR